MSGIKSDRISGMATVEGNGGNMPVDESNSAHLREIAPRFEVK